MARIGSGSDTQERALIRKRGLSIASEAINRLPYAPEGIHVFSVCVLHFQFRASGLVALCLNSPTSYQAAFACRVHTSVCVNT